MSLAKLLAPRVCELGKIKIGGLGDERTGKSGGKYRMPVKYDEFRITTLNRGPDGLLVEDSALMAALPKDADGKLRTLPVSLLSNDLEEVMQASYLWYNGKRLAGKSDGETLTVHFDHEKGTWLDKPKVVPWDAKYADIKVKGVPLFKLHCTLNVVIASQIARFGGLYKFRTTSRITSDQLYGSLVQLRQLTGGVLRGLPLQLVVRPMQVAPNGQPTTIYVVHVELRGADIAAIQARALELAQFEVQNIKQIAATQAEYRQLLAAPDEFADVEEEAEVGQEFHSHQQDGQPGRLPERPADKAPVPAPAPDPEPAAPAPAPAAQEEGEHRSDFTRTSPALPSAAPSVPPRPVAPVSGAGTPAASVAATTSTTRAMATEPAPKPAAPAPGPTIQQLLGLMHDLGVSWTEIRDRAEGRAAEEKRALQEAVS